MINKLIYQSRVTEVDAAATRMNSAYESTTLSSDTFLAALFTDLAASLKKLGAAINRIKAESELEEKDEVRDNAVRALYYMILGYVHNPVAAVQTAAEELQTIFDNYGISITGESYAVESSLVNSLLTDLAAPEPVAAISALPGCAAQIAALQTAQDEFEAARIAFETEKGREGIQQSASEIKKEVVKLINEKLVVYLRAMIQVDDATYGDFARTVAEIIDDNNQTVKRRRNND